MTAGHQARINLRCFGDLGRGQTGHSDTKYAMFWLTSKGGMIATVISVTNCPPSIKIGVMHIYARRLLANLKIYKIHFHGAGIKSVDTLIAASAHKIFFSMKIQNICQAQYSFG